jgi:peptidoglycan glycosyltransferase
MVHVIVFVSLLFFSIIGYLTYIQIFKAEQMAQNPYNKRQMAREEKIIRGTIYDRNGIVLAETNIEENGEMQRVYTQNKLYSHVIGYSSRQYGKAGIESYYNNDLLALTGDNTVAKIKQTITGEPIRGHNLLLTINHELQKTAESLLKGKKGSIVALNPKTGEVLAMVSKPDYNPNNLTETWSALVEDAQSPLLNRSLSGLYPPGSIYKPIIASAVLQNAGIDTNYDCTGTITIDGYTLTDANKRGHGYLDLRQSIIVSCNTNFARMGVALGSEAVTDISKDFLMGEKLKSYMPIAQSRYPYNQGMNPTDVAAVSIGQGKLLVTPMHMAAVAATFANNGMMMTPYIVEEVRSADGRVISSGKGEGDQIISEAVANEVKDMMVAAVREGTGTNARISGVDVAGKTGTAENETGESHAWFIGFAPANDPQIAVAIILESEGKSGGAAAAPIAREVIRQGLKGGQ